MSFTATHVRSMNDGDGTVTSTIAITADAKDNRDVTIPASTTNLEIDLDLVLSRVKSVVILSDVALTIKTNSSSAPDTTITLPANRGIDWTNLDGHTNPFGSVDLTKIFVTNATSGAANLQIRVIYDSTP